MKHYFFIHTFHLTFIHIVIIRSHQMELKQWRSTPFSDTPHFLTTWRSSSWVIWSPSLTTSSGTELCSCSSASSSCSTTSIPALSRLGTSTLTCSGEHMETYGIFHMLVYPQNIWKIFRDFLLAKNDFWLILRPFHFFPLKVQKYLENFQNFAHRAVGKGGYHKGKNKSV